MILKIAAVLPASLLLISIVVVTIKRGLSAGHLFGHKHGERIFSVDSYAHQSKLLGVNALYKIICSLLLLIISVCSNNFYVFLFIISLCAFVTVVLGGLSLGKYINLLTIPIVFMVMGTIIILIEFSRTFPVTALASFKMGFFYIYITRDGLYRVLFLWGRAFGAISAMYALTLSTPSNELFTALDRLHCPALLTEMMNMMYRFIFTLMDTQVEMNNAAQSRLGYRNYRTALNTFGHIGSNLLVVSFKKANDYYNALESRLYNGKLQFLVENKPVTAGEIVFAAVVFSYILFIQVKT